MQFRNFSNTTNCSRYARAILLSLSKIYSNSFIRNSTRNHVIYTYTNSPVSSTRMLIIKWFILEYPQGHWMAERKWRICVVVFCWVRKSVNWDLWEIIELPYEDETAVIRRSFESKHSFMFQFPTSSLSESRAFPCALLCAELCGCSVVCSACYVCVCVLVHVSARVGALGPSGAGV